MGVIQLVLHATRLKECTAAHIAGIRSFTLRRCAWVIGRAWLRVRSRWLWFKLSRPARFWRKAICAVRFILRGKKWGFGRRARAAFVMRQFLSEHRVQRDMSGYVR